MSSFTTIMPFPSHSPTLYQLRGLNRDLDEDDAIFASDAERLSVFYPNAGYDFYGVPSNALCVYKSGSAWPIRTGMEAQRIIREARGDYGHPMQPAWLELGERVYNLLDNLGVRWTSIDPVAFAEAGAKTFSPLLLWIGVVPESLQFELANTAAEAITKLISEAGFRDFEIGFRESVVNSLAAPKMLPFDPFYDTIPEFRKQFTSTLGIAIAPLKDPCNEGTGALYIQENSKGGRVFLLTCAHVVQPPSEHHNTAITRHKYVIAHGHSSYNGSLQSMMATIAEMECLIKDNLVTLQRLGEYKEGELAFITEKRAACRGWVENAQKRIHNINLFHTEITKYWTVPRERIIGEVIHVEPIGVGIGPQKFTEDWALIALDESKFNYDKFGGNVVYVGGNLTMADYGYALFPRVEDQAEYTYPEDGLLQARGTVPLEDIYNPKHLDANGEQCLLVVKNGCTTGTTVGRVLGMESILRTYEVGKSGEIARTSMAIAVLPLGNIPGPFSAPGDSGSIVLDRNGRILGMITAGSGRRSSIDVTYVTPYTFLDEMIKKRFPESSLYEVV